MGFDLGWLKERLARLQTQTGEIASHAVYGATCGAAIYPILEQAQAGNPAQAFASLLAVGGSVATGVLGNQLFGWLNRAGAVPREEVEEWLLEHAEACRNDLNALLASVQAIEATKRELADEDRQWFVETLRRELSDLGCLPRFAADLRLEIVFRDGDAPDPAAARCRYLQELVRRCRFLPITDLGHVHGLTQGITLDQVYIELQTTTPKQKQEKKSKRGLPLPDEYLSAREAATRDAALVLLGDPGSGKSSFVKELAAEIAGAELDGTPGSKGRAGHPLPLLVELRTLVGCLANADLAALATADRQAALAGLVRDHLVESLAAHHCTEFAAGLQDALNAKACLVIFDGLDEVATAQRALVRDAVAAFRMHYRPARLIVTCRRRSYEGEAVFPDLPAHTLAPLDEGQIRRFCAAWYAAQGTLGNLQPGENADELGAKLTEAATGDPKLLGLATNPMLLTSMAIVHQQQRELPKERAAVYARAIDVLLTKWPKGKGQTAQQPSPALAGLLRREAELLRLMRRLAYRAHERNEGRARGDGSDVGDLTRMEALALLEGELKDTALASEFLDYVDQRAGLLVGRGGGGTIPATYGFIHRTFQEYLAGCELVTRHGVEGIRTKLKGGDYWYLAVQFGIEHCLFNEASASVFIEGFPELLCPSSIPRTQAVWRGHLLAAHQVFLGGMDRAEPSLVKRLRKRLCSILADERLPSPIERAEAGRLLARLGDPRFLPDCYFLPDDPMWGFVEISAGNSRTTDDEPPVKVDGFLIGKWPVTNAQFRAFAEQGGYRDSAWWSEAIARGRWDKQGFHAEYPEEITTGPTVLPDPFGLSNHPAVGVSWYEASAYCAWLTERLRRDSRTPEGLRNLLAAGGIVRLPNEAEWVRAARGDTERSFPWGDKEDANRMNYDATTIGSTSAVGCFPGGTSLAFPGVEELAGNVWEWCEDAIVEWRVMHGGGYWGDAWNCRSACPDQGGLTDHLRSLGFRLAAGQPPDGGTAVRGASRRADATPDLGSEDKEEPCR